MVAAVVVEAGIAAVVVATERGLELPTGGGEDLLTLGWRVCPPRVFTMVELD